MDTELLVGVWVALVIVLIFLVILSIILFVYYRKGSGSIGVEDGANVLKRYPDKDKAAAILNELTHQTYEIMDMENGLSVNCIGSEAMHQLRSHFDKNNVFENDVVTAMGNASETIDASQIKISMREKYSGKLLPKSLIQFVYLHELAHVATPKKYLILDGSVSMKEGSHTDVYWAVFSMLLHLAHKAGFYHPVKYSLRPTTYHSEIINSNPFYSKGWEKIINRQAIAEE